MVAKIRGDGPEANAAAGEIHQAIPELRNQLQPWGRHGASLHLTKEPAAIPSNAGANSANCFRPHASQAEFKINQEPKNGRNTIFRPFGIRSKFGCPGSLLSARL